MKGIPTPGFHCLLALLAAIAFPVISSGQPHFFDKHAGRQESDTKSSPPLIRISASYPESPELTDYTVIYFYDKATYEFDGLFDALKLMNTDLSFPNLYTITPDGTNLSINALPPAAKTMCRVPLGLKTTVSGSITIKIKDIDSSMANCRVYLTDTTTGTEQNLIPDLEYTFPLPAGDYRERFFINISDVTTNIRQPFSDENDFTVYQTSGTIVVKISHLAGRDGTLTVFDLKGQPIINNKLYGPGHYEYNTKMSEGVYIVSLVSGRSFTTRKIILSNQPK